jgi:hypothetical protein
MKSSIYKVVKCQHADCYDFPKLYFDFKIVYVFWGEYFLFINSCSLCSTHYVFLVIPLLEVLFEGVHNPGQNWKLFQEPVSSVSMSVLRNVD